MALISTLTLNPDTGNYSGKFKTLSVNAPMTIKFEDNGGDQNLPSYRVYVGKFEAGAGWNKLSESSGNHYVSIRIEDPFLGTAYFNLITTTDQETGKEKYLLLWSRAED